VQELAIAIEKRPGEAQPHGEEAQERKHVAMHRPGSREQAAIGADHADALRAAIPDASFHLWEGVGHLPFVEAPAAFEETVLAFLRR